MILLEPQGREMKQSETSGEVSEITPGLYFSLSFTYELEKRNPSWLPNLVKVSGIDVFDYFNFLKFLISAKQ